MHTNLQDSTNRSSKEAAAAIVMTTASTFHLSGRKTAESEMREVEAAASSSHAAPRPHKKDRSRRLRASKEV